MAHAYTPGLKVTPLVRHRVRRVLPIAGNLLVAVGDHVAPRDVVARTELPGDVTPVNLANKLSISPTEVAAAMLKREGDAVSEGDVLARTKGLFGFFQAEYRSTVSGTLESISDVTGQIMIRGAPQPVEVCAYLQGDVVGELPGEGVEIEATVAFIQGIFGIGGEAFGPLRMACTRADEELTAERISEDMQGAVVVGGARMTGSAIQRARDVGAVAVVSGGMDDQDLRDALGYDLGVAITGSEHIGITLVITEGFGEIAMADRSFALLNSHAGEAVSVNGATQIRAGVMRPEIVIPAVADDTPVPTDAEMLSGELRVGATVRMIRDPYFGLIGTVTELPTQPQVLGSGSKARVLHVRVKDREPLIVPRANVELIENG